MKTPQISEIDSCGETQITKQSSQSEEDQENLSDISDSDIDHFILTEEEVTIKRCIWQYMHRDWLEEQDRKKECQAEKKLTGKKRSRRRYEGETSHRVLD